MKLYEMRQGGFLVLRPSGQLTSANSSDFEREIHSRIQSNDSQVILDLSDLNYISSAGLRVLLVLARFLKQGNSTMAVCSMNNTVNQVFEVTGFASVLSTYATLNEAMAAG